MAGAYIQKALKLIEFPNYISDVYIIPVKRAGQTT